MRMALAHQVPAALAGRIGDDEAGRVPRGKSSLAQQQRGGRGKVFAMAGPGARQKSAQRRFIVVGIRPPALPVLRVFKLRLKKIRQLAQRQVGRLEVKSQLSRDLRQEGRVRFRNFMINFVRRPVHAGAGSIHHPVANELRPLGHAHHAQAVGERFFDGKFGDSFRAQRQRQQAAPAG